MLEQRQPWVAMRKAHLIQTKGNMVKRYPEARSYLGDSERHFGHKNSGTKQAGGRGHISMSEIAVPWVSG